MKRILLVKTSSLGDVIHNLPVVSDILQHYPEAQIDWVVEEGFSDIPKLHPAVSKIITVAVRRWRKQLFSKQTWQEIFAFKKQVSTSHYDLIIDTQGLIKSAVMTTLAHGQKYGLNKHSAREPLASYCYNHKYNVARDQHAVVRNRELAAYACGYKKPNDAPNYGLDDGLEDGFAKIKTDGYIDLPEKFIIGLHGTSKESKLWPTDLWIELVNALANQQCSLLLPWASDAEHQRAKKIAANHSNAIVLPKLSITQLAAITSRAWAAVGVDTGLSHLSAALNIPTVAIFTDTNPARTGVMASADGEVINLGGVKQIPSVTSVTNAIQQVTSPD